MPVDFSKNIIKIRSATGLSQKKFAEIIGVSQQSVQKWEAGVTRPTLETAIIISRKFDVSVDAIVLGSDERIRDELKLNRSLQPRYANFHHWEAYEENSNTEYQQCESEGLDVGVYADLFKAISLLPRTAEKKRLGDVLFDIVRVLPKKKDYEYDEPSDLEGITTLRKEYAFKKKFPTEKELYQKLTGAWTGRACGCLLGKTVECIRTDELIPLLKRTDNYPMHRYILRSDMTEEIYNAYKFPLRNRCFADESDGMPVDDDTNYTVLGQMIVEKYGKNFTPRDVAYSWIELQSKNAYCTAERVAFCNFINGYEPPDSAEYKNPFREWIGAQIRADYYGYINPGDHVGAAQAAFNDASISHVKNGIYGEMFVASMIAAAAVTDDIKDIIECGLSVIPATSRLYEVIKNVISGYNKGVSAEDAFGNIHSLWNEYDQFGWCHTISNAMIVASALLYGKGDFGKSICLAVQTGFDTDCNGATVGSVLGMKNGISSIGEEWTTPIAGKIHTSIFGAETVEIKDCVDKTLNHIKAK